jgi:hypothetical protein
MVYRVHPVSRMFCSFRSFRSNFQGVSTPMDENGNLTRHWSLQLIQAGAYPSLGHHPHPHPHPCLSC